MSVEAVIEIQLTQGKFAVIDAADVELVSGYKWCAYKFGRSGKFYAVSRSRSNGKKSRHIYMHRLILGLTDRNVQADHIDGDGLNNRRNNLRSCTHGQNQQNRGMMSTNTSGYKGVSWSARGGKWRARIWFEGKNRDLGSFTSKEEAYAAYCEAAKKLQGDFANFGRPSATPE